MDLYEAYKVLGVSFTDSLEDVKRAYRKLLLRYHPDKCGGGEESAERFLRIQNAYTVVIQNKESNVNFFLMFLFLAKSMQSGPQDVALNIVVPIEDIYNGKVKKLSYRRVDESLKKVCTSVYLELVDFRERYVVPGYGDFDMWTERWSDLVISVTVDYTSFENVRLENLLGPTDICVSIKVSVYEHFFGVSRAISFFNNTTISLTNHVPQRDGSTVVKCDQGLIKGGGDGGSRGDLYIFLETDLTIYNERALHEHREVIQKIFEELNK